MVEIAESVGKMGIEGGRTLFFKELQVIRNRYMLVGMEKKT